MMRTNDNDMTIALTAVIIHSFIVIQKVSEHLKRLSELLAISGDHDSLLSDKDWSALSKLHGKTTNDGHDLSATKEHEDESGTKSGDDGSGDNGGVSHLLTSVLEPLLGACRSSASALLLDQSDTSTVMINNASAMRGALEPFLPPNHNFSSPPGVTAASSSSSSTSTTSTSSGGATTSAHAQAVLEWDEQLKQEVGRRRVTCSYSRRCWLLSLYVCFCE